MLEYTTQIEHHSHGHLKVNVSFDVEQEATVVFLHHGTGLPLTRGEVRSLIDLIERYETSLRVMKGDHVFA